MKNKFVNYFLNIIKNNNPNYDEIKIVEIKYGLEGFYLTVTKLLFIFMVALLLNILKEMIILLICFNVLRSTGFGLHATKSWICLLSSTLIFIGLPFIAKIIIIPASIKVILGILSIALIFKYAPADTKKRPLINAKKRKYYKYITTLKTMVLVILCLYVPNNILSNLILFGIYIQIVIILPITYKIFNLSYDNYKTYKLNLN